MEILLYIFLNSFLYNNHFADFKFYDIVNDQGKEYILGIDVSHYQGNILWNQLEHPKDSIHFVFIRSTMGNNRVDSLFKKNFEQANTLLITGAYHYYDVYQRPEGQAQNFIKNTPLGLGNMRPVLDIERESKKYSMKVLKSHLKIWLDIVEKHYGVKPIIYTPFYYWEKHLEDDFGDYPVWLAAYSAKSRMYPSVLSVHAVQYSDKLRLKGVGGNVDANKIRRTKLHEFLIE